MPKVDFQTLFQTHIYGYWRLILSRCDPDSLKAGKTTLKSFSDNQDESELDESNLPESGESRCMTFQLKA